MNLTRNAIVIAISGAIAMLALNCLDLSLQTLLIIFAALTLLLALGRLFICPHGEVMKALHTLLIGILLLLGVQ